MAKPSLVFRGPVTTASGYGVHARQLLDALLRTRKYDISVQLINWGNTGFLTPQQDPRVNVYEQLAQKAEQERAQGKRYDISVQVTIPDEFERVARLNIAVTAGIECDHVTPQWLLKANEACDVLIVPSHHASQVFHQTAYQGSDGSTLRLQKPAIVVPEGVDVSIFNNAGPLPGESEKFSFSTKFNFLHVGLGLDRPFGEDRKNIANLVRWFCERFSDDPNVGLILKVNVVNSSKMDEQLVKRRLLEIKQVAGVNELPRIHLIHDRLTDRQLAGLMRNESVKAFVTLTHGEGFGLPILEAAACGLPVIATDWSGHLDFLTKDGRKLFVPVAYKMEEIPPSAVGFMPQGSKWASAIETDVKEKLFKVSKSYAAPKKWANELSAHVIANYNLVKTGEAFTGLVAEAWRQMVKAKPKSQEEVVRAFKDEYKTHDPSKRKLLLTMPMSAGDVYLVQGVIPGLRERHPDCEVFFATSPQYAEIAKSVTCLADHIVDFQSWMMDIPTLEDLFDEVYTPNIGVQLRSSNWVHRGKGLNIAEEFASHCAVHWEPPAFVCEDHGLTLPEEYLVFNPGSGKGQWSARNYRSWQPVVDSLVAAGLTVVQVGSADEPFFDGCIDARGKTTPGQLASIVTGSIGFFGIDSFPMHIAGNHLRAGKPLVALFGSSYAASTGPLSRSGVHLNVLETSDRNGCDRACYQYTCKVDPSDPCINNIEARSVVERLAKGLNREIPFVEKTPKISGYTHVLNAESQGFPYIESIVSMLGFCDEVVVVDGGSTDKTRQQLGQLQQHVGEKLQIHDHEWDPEEPGMDGMQKAYARAMCTGEYLWQQDADEVVHEADYEKIRKLVRTFPKDVNLMHLPVVELWGDATSVRTDRHSWKWRLSRNDFQITHGIVKHARLEDPKTGRTYAREGQSDGCEYIDIMTGQYIEHKGFYTAELEELRQDDPAEYGRRMNRIFQRLPSVYHYSWVNLKRKVKNFRDFWDGQWNVLYQTKREPRFPDVVDEESLEARAIALKAQGGEHGFAETFKLERSNPKVMQEWIERIGK